MKKYAVNEIFYSLQGEGRNAGRAAVFIRFSGCNLACPFCDTDFKERRMMTAQEIVEEAQQVGAKTSLCVLTGGEPTMQADYELISLLHFSFGTIALETNGTRPIPPGVNFVTVSPKSDFFAAAPAIAAQQVDDVKVVFDGEHDPRHWLAEFKTADYFYLQPCDTGDATKNAELQTMCVNYILNNPRWRLSLQTHKIVGIR